MTLRVEDKWVWDFWFAQAPPDYHIFYLQAPRALGNPDLRHRNSTIGHAVSTDLTAWEILPDALHPSREKNAWDSLANWTGSVIHHEGHWFMFYTGISQADKGAVQRIGLAISTDLVHWEKYAHNPVIRMDPACYETLDKRIWYEQAWRDPCIFTYEGKFHALITARINQGKPDERGVLGHASSDNLFDWQVEDPLTQPGEFVYLEVPQIVEANQRWYLLFCVEGSRYSERRLKRPRMKPNSGTHYMVADHPLGPFHQPEHDVLFGDEQGSAYAGKLIQDKDGQWVLMTSIVYNSSGVYVGDISNPLPINFQKNGEMSIRQDPTYQ